MNAPADTHAFDPVVIVPVHNAAGDLPALLQRLARIGLPLIVIDDGSTDGTSDALTAWHRDNDASALVVHSHERHRGRGHALRSGFAAAIKAGHTHALTLSADSNDAPGQIQKLVASAREHRHSLILASVNKPHSRGVTSVLLSLEAGVHVSDPRARALSRERRGL
jgi:glycosyltransferase involved in cell wall biosynthesis